MIPPLTSLQAFEAIARRKSFAVAAAELHLTPSAVSHQVARLEDLLGVRLFERSSKGVELTPAGQGYLQKVGGALGAIHAATDDLRLGVQNTLYVHSSPSFANLWLMPRLRTFAQQCPGISLMLSASPQHSDFQVGRVDIDIRYGVPSWPDLHVEPIFRERVLPLASPELLAHHPIGQPADLLQVPLIESSINVVQWPDWFARFGRKQRPERFGLRFDRAMMSLDAAVQGMGVALESATLASGHLAAGRLQQVFDEKMSLQVEAHFVVYPARNAARVEVVRFLDWLRNAVQPLPT